MAKNNNGKQIFVERETFEKNGRTIFSYFIKGVIRGKDVKVAVVPPDKGGYIQAEVLAGFEIVEIGMRIGAFLRDIIKEPFKFLALEQLL